MEQMRNEFERWLKDKFGYRQDYIDFYRGEGNYRAHPGLRERWEGWQASRQAIEISPPNFFGRLELPADYENGYLDALEDYDEKISAAGLRIKGE